MRRLRDFDWSIFWRPEYKVYYIGEGNAQAYLAFKDSHKSFYQTKRDAQKQIAEYVVTRGTGAYINDFAVRRHYVMLGLLPRIAFGLVMIWVAGAGLVHTFQEIFLP